MRAADVVSAEHINLEARCAQNIATCIRSRLDDVEPYTLLELYHSRDSFGLDPHQGILRYPKGS